MCVQTSQKALIEELQEQLQEERRENEHSLEDMETKATHSVRLEAEVLD